MLRIMKNSNQVIVILICFISTSVGRKILIEDNSEQHPVLNCALDIANKYFDYREHSVILYNAEVKIVDQFVKRYEGTVIIEAKRDFVPPKQVVLIIDTFQSFSNITAKLKPDLRGKTVLSSSANFLILILSSPNRIELITHFLWSSYVMNVIIIVKDRRNGAALFTYYPYKNHFQCQNTRPQLIGYCKQNLLPPDVYPDKMRNMRGCPLYISKNKLYHPETEKKIALYEIKKAILSLLGTIMNFTPNITERDYVSIESDRAKNWSYSLSDVINGTSDISISSVPLGINRVGVLDYSVPYFRVRLAWIAPPLSPGPVWWRLVFPLKGYLGILFTSVAIFIKILPLVSKWQPINKFCRRYFKHFGKLKGVPLRSWGVMMGQPVRLAPRRFRDFYILCLWMWFAFVIRSAYQSVLIVALKTDTVTGNFANLKEAVDAGYTFGGREGILTHFEGADSLIIEGFKVVPEESFNDVFDDVIEGRTKCVLATSLEYVWAYCEVKGIKDDTCVYVIPDSIMTVPLVIWMRHQSPFVRPLSVWLPRLIESGLLEKEEQDAILNPTFLVLKSIDPTPLTSEQTAGCFLCLLFGIIISTTVFAVEILWHKHNTYD